MTETRRETIVVPQVVNVGTGTEAPIWKTVFVPMVIKKVVKLTITKSITPASVFVVVSYVPST
jgi:hypothetical protein